MGIFTKKKTEETVFTDPVLTYHISQNLSGKLNVTPTAPNAFSYSITIMQKKAWRDTIEVAVHRSIQSTYQQQADVVGHCLIQTVQGKFLELHFDAYGTSFALDSKGSNRNTDKSTYALSVPGLAKCEWRHEQSALSSIDKRLKLVDDASGQVLARFGGATHGVSEFGVLEVYDPKVASDQNWCGLLILTAVCVYAREERNRERRKKIAKVTGSVVEWGGLLSGVPISTGS